MRMKDNMSMLNVSVLLFITESAAISEACVMLQLYSVYVFKFSTIGCQVITCFSCNMLNSFHALQVS